MAYQMTWPLAQPPKEYLRPLILILGALGLLLPNVSETTFLFCLKSNIEPLTINRSSNGQAITDNDALNNFLIDNDIVNLEKWIPQATEQDYDGDIYLNRIYRAYVSDSNRLSINY